jgi:hypothetical protein
VGTAGNDGTAAYQWLSGFNYSFYVINDIAVLQLQSINRKYNMGK